MVRKTWCIRLLVLWTYYSLLKKTLHYLDFMGNILFLYIPKFCCLVTMLYLTLCDLLDYSPSGSPVHGLLWTRILEWGCHFLLQGISWPRDQTHVSCIYCTDRRILCQSHLRRLSIAEYLLRKLTSFSMVIPILNQIKLRNSELVLCQACTLIIQRQ